MVEARESVRQVNVHVNFLQMHHKLTFIQACIYAFKFSNFMSHDKLLCKTFCFPHRNPCRLVLFIFFPSGSVSFSGKGSFEFLDFSSSKGIVNIADLMVREQASRSLNSFTMESTTFVNILF